MASNGSRPPVFRVQTGGALARVHPSEDQTSFVVSSASGLGPSFIVKTLHISSRTSDAYLGGDKKYGGIVIFACDGEQDWYTANETHCKSGYVVIKQTDTMEFQELQRKWRERGRVHGVIYRIAFGESCDDVTIVGEGFGIIEGQLKTTSGVFNPTHGDDYHDSSVYMNPDSARYVEALVDIWKREGPNFLKKEDHIYRVKELSDYIAQSGTK